MHSTVISVINLCAGFILVWDLIDRGRRIEVKTQKGIIEQAYIMFINPIVAAMHGNTPALRRMVAAMIRPVLDVLFT